MSEPYLGQVIAVGFNFAPVGWALCNGQTLAISENIALFQLLGTTYGGDGVNTFQLPDLRGRVSVCAGQGPGLQPYLQGELAGRENVTLIAGQIGAHTHNFMATSTAAAGAAPGPGLVLAAAATGDEVYSNAGADTTLAGSSISQAPGGSLPHENRQPYTVINYIIALQGVFPSQT